MKFRFAYQQLLRHRKTTEDMAQREWAEAQRLVNLAELDLRQMYKAIDDSRTRASLLAQAGGDAGPGLVQIDEFIRGQGVRVERQRQKIRDLMRAAEEKQMVLIEAAKEFKTLDRLRERQLETFKDVLKKKELKFLDEIVTTRFKREERT